MMTLGSLLARGRTGSTAAFRDRMLDFPQLNEMLGTREMLDLGKRYDH